VSKKTWFMHRTLDTVEATSKSVIGMLRAQVTKLEGRETVSEPRRVAPVPDPGAPPFTAGQEDSDE
jgi:hypothetical protein